jgi:hypothetical protein
VGLIAKILRRFREDHAGRRRGSEDRRQAEAQRAQEDERRQGPVDRRTGARRRVPEPEGNQ